ncbi:MAG: transposase, partial [Tepidiformaceae bacterium]
SVDVRHNMPGTAVLPPDPRRTAGEAARLNFEPYVLGLEERRIVDQTIWEVCSFKCWHVLALNVRTNHVHLLVDAHAEPAAVMSTAKAWATRRLTEAGLIPQGRTIWTSGGSKRKLWNDRAVDNAWDYVVHGQGPDLL